MRKSKDFSLTDLIYTRLFGLFGTSTRKFNFDVTGHGGNIDLTKTSYNLDIKVSTYQSRAENIYFYISLFDYETKEEYQDGFFYIKDNHGLINTWHLLALADIITEGNKILKDLYNNHDLEV